jgi:hypothetical protein
MKLQDLEKKVMELEQEFELKKKIAIKEYCDANNPYKVGDKFTDHIGTILIEKIGYVYRLWDGDSPCCIYNGPELKKDGTPKKNGDKRTAYQTNDVKLR